MRNREIRFVITDIDGVVVDRMPILRAAFVEVLRRRYGILAEFSEEYYYDTAGIPVWGQLEEALKIHGINLTADEINALVEEFILISRKTEPEIFPGVPEALRRIKESGRYLLASSGSPTAELKRLFAKHSFPYDYFLGSDQTLKRVDHIRLFAGHFSLGPEEFCRAALLIDDGPVGVKIAKENGIFTIGITNTVSGEKLREAGADAVVANIADIFLYLS